MEKTKDFVITVKPDTVLYAGINTHKDGYNSAGISCKIGEKEYLSINYEWSSEEDIPIFVMDVMAFIKNNNAEVSKAWPGKEKAYKEYKDRDK